MTYTQLDFRTDIDWLEGQGLDRTEAMAFIRNMIERGYMMTEKEYINFMRRNI